MLLTKEVEMKWTHANKKYFIEKGYEFTKYFDTFMCKVEDLSSSSAKDVQCKCDYCGNPYFKKYNAYIDSHKNIDHDACVKCSPKKSKDVCEIIYGDKDWNVVKLKENQESNIKRKNEFIKKLIKSINKKSYILFPFVYENSNQIMPYMCKKHISLGIQYSNAYYLSTDNTNCYGCICEKNRESEVFDYDYVKTVIEANGKNKLISTTYTKANDRNLKILCAKCQKNTYTTSLNKFQTRQQIYCLECSYELRSGENNFNWCGGVSSLNAYLRSHIRQWKKDSLKASNYLCDITKQSGYLEVHHLNKNFKDIVDETLKITGLDIRQEIGEYTEEELKVLASTCLDLHYKYGLGICLLREYHLEFHNFYGRYNNTPEQYYEFKKEIQEELLLESQQDSLLLCSNL